MIEAAVKVGIPEEKVKELLDSEDFKDQVRIEEQIAYNNGINAVPFFIIDEKIAVPGALSKDQMKELLKQVLEN